MRGKLQVNDYLVRSNIQEGYKNMLGETIRLTRQKAFLSQEEFAKELNVSVSTINRWETGKVKPNLSALKNLKEFCEKQRLPFEELEKDWFEDGLC